MYIDVQCLSAIPSRQIRKWQRDFDYFSNILSGQKETNEEIIKYIMNKPTSCSDCPLKT